MGSCLHGQDVCSICCFRMRQRQKRPSSMYTKKVSYIVEVYPMGSSDKDSSNREITYRVGWKKGRIEFAHGEDCKVASIERLPLRSPLIKFARMFIWRPV